MTVFVPWLRRFFLNATREEGLAGSVYAAMVDSLFGTLLGFAALALASIFLGVLTFMALPGLASALMLGAIVLVVAVRSALMVAYHRWKRAGRTRVSEVAIWEIAYAMVGVAHTLAIGVASAYNIFSERGELALVVSIVIEMGIAGCIAGRNGSRPKLVLLQLCACFTPTLVALALRRSGESFVLGLLIVMFIVATLSSVRAVYATLRTALDGARTVRNLTKRLERSVGLFDAALNNMTSGLLLLDSKRRLVVANERVKELFGRDFLEPLIGRPVQEVACNLYTAFDLPAAEAQSVTDGFARAMSEGGATTMTIVDHRRARVFDMRLQVIGDGRVVFNVDDVTDQRTKDREIFRLAHHDHLTGLYNRASLVARLRECEGGEHEVVVMYLDLDRFKQVNDDFGHATGDQILIEVAERLSACIRPGDFLARLGGDEFVLVFPAAEQRVVIDRIAERLVAAIARPFRIDTRFVNLGVSAGLCVAYVAKGETVEETLRIADVALYEAKFRGRGRAIWYEPGMDDRARSQREMIVELRDALASGRGVSLVYQPVVDCRSGSIVACEALMRWTHPKFGEVPPAVFVPLAEENGLICELGKWCLERACRDALAWPDAAVKVAVNISGLQFRQEGVSALVEKVLRTTRLAPTRLELEITESVFATDLDKMAIELDTLAAQGVGIALDDFGTGFSSLSLVHQLPFDKIKLDRSFVAKLDADPTVVNLIASIIQMMQIMRKTVVIEGVETAAELALVTSGQGRFVQGFYFSQPVPQETLLVMLARDADASALQLIG